MHGAYARTYARTHAACHCKTMQDDMESELFSPHRLFGCRPASPPPSSPAPPGGPTSSALRSSTEAEMVSHRASVSASRPLRSGNKKHR